MASTDTVVTMTLFRAYRLMLPTSHAIAHWVKSIVVGNANGVLKIAAFVLKLERIIHTRGMKNRSASSPSAARTT